MYKLGHISGSFRPVFCCQVWPQGKRSNYLIIWRIRAELWGLQEECTLQQEAVWAGLSLMTSFDFLNIGIKIQMNQSFCSENNFQTSTSAPVLSPPVPFLPGDWGKKRFLCWPMRVAWILPLERSLDMEWDDISDSIMPLPCLNSVRTSQFVFPRDCHPSIWKLKVLNTGWLYHICTVYSGVIFCSHSELLGHLLTRLREDDASGTKRVMK